MLCMMSNAAASTLEHPTHDMTRVYFPVTWYAQITLSDTASYQVSGVHSISDALLLRKNFKISLFLVSG